MTGWSLPGYDVERLLGAGAGAGGPGEVWLARERSTLEPVAVRVVTVDGREEDLDRLRREAVQVAAVRHPHLVRVRSVLPVDGGVAVVGDFAEGGSLAALLAVRGTLTAGEVLTIGAPVATALAAIHAEGRVHGRVSGTNVLFTGDGRPLLADFGLPSLATSADPAAPADDVRALGNVLAAALDPRAPAQLRACVQRAGSTDPATRPSAAEFAGDLRRNGRPEPLRLDGASAGGPVPLPVQLLRSGGADRARPPGRPPAVQAPRPSVALVGSVLAALVAAVLAGRSWAAADRPAGPPPLQVLRSAASAAPAGPSAPAAAGVPTAASTPAAPAAPVNWPAVLAGLDARRDSAVAGLDAAALAAVYAAGSPPLARDAASIRALAAAGARPSGLRLQVQSVRLVRHTPGRVTLRVVDRLPAYDLVSADGRVFERRPGRGATAWAVDLVPAGDGWRIAAVARA